MKKEFIKFGYAGALMLAGAFAFVSCSSEDDGLSTEGLDNAAKVKTQFAFNIPVAKGTRMTSGIVQEGGTFRGMVGMTLIPFSTTPAADAAITTANVVKDLTIESTELASTSSKVYHDVQIPLGTTDFLFYGEGGALSSTYDEVAEKATNGYLNYNLSALTNTNDITFALGGIDYASANATVNDMVTILNAVESANFNSTKWEDVADGALKTLYTNFVSLTAASPFNVKAALEDVYNEANAIALSVGSNVDEKGIAAAIKTAIENYFDVTDSNSDLIYELGNYKTIGGAANYNALDTYLSGSNIPQGALAVDYDNVNGNFKSATTVTVGSGNTVALSSLSYPASLMYFANTKLRALDAAFTGWPTNTSDWTNATWTGWTDAVTATTKTVALKDNIQYGVARLATTVKCDGSALTDNSGALNGYTDASITVPGDGFPVTGVFVGGQPASVGWEMLPTAAERNNVIYDSKMNGTVAAKNATAEGTNYTLTLATSATEKVNVAVEFTNNTGKDFYGANGWVPAGAKFYLVAQLDPASETVFKQDFTTTANLTIKNLKNAYVTIPDLRAAKLQLGLSVDLTWQAGLTFDLDI